jgi:putative toxin-antitoxin system antitoxin component (TIGR02293 family)
MAMTTRSKTRRTNKTGGSVRKRRGKGRSLGLRVDDSVQLVGSVQAGFEFEKLLVFHKASGWSMEQIAQFAGISKRTLTRRRSEGRLRPDESDRLLRLSRILELAVDLFEGDAAAGRDWLEKPQSALSGAVPLEFASTDVGAREVEKLIARLEHGVFA